MASNSTGKWVERAATTGGGRSYGGQRPVNFYAAIVLICVVGLMLIAYSRYERTHAVVSSAGPPIVGQQWDAGFAIDICGTIKPNLPANDAKSKNFTTSGNGVISVLPANSSQSGANATLEKFISNYRGLELSQSVLQYPGGKAYTNGTVCPAGTPDAGKAGVVIVNYWPNYESTTAKQPAGDPQNLLFSQGQLITAAFVPTSATIPKPPQSVQTATQAAVSAAAGQAPGASTTTSTLKSSVVTPTTAVTPTTSAATTTTAAPASTTSTTLK